MTRFRVRPNAGAHTHVGLLRTNNEDNYFMNERNGLFLVADGMGGHAFGELASRTAIQVIEDAVSHAFRDEEKRRDIACLKHTVENSIRCANQAIYRLNRDRGFPDGTGMGTAISGLLIAPGYDFAIIFHIGDCRVYRYRDGILERLTTDHSLYQAWIESGRQGVAPRRNLILRVIGPYPEVTADLQEANVRSGDAFLLCSDGLTDMISDSEIDNILSMNEGVPPDGICQQLVSQANRRGGMDNVTVVLVRLRDTEEF